MTENEIATLIISLLSLAISIFAAFKTYALGEYQLRLTNRNEFQKLLVDVNKVLIENPELWAIYDSHPISRDWLSNPKEKARLEAFAHMILNVFECVFTFYADSPRLTKAERASFEAWKAFLNDILRDSSAMREILDKPDSRLMYNAKLIAEIDSILHPASLSVNSKGDYSAGGGLGKELAKDEREA